MFNSIPKFNKYDNVTLNGCEGLPYAVSNSLKLVTFQDRIHISQVKSTVYKNLTIRSFTLLI